MLTNTASRSAEKWSKTQTVMYET